VVFEYCSTVLPGADRLQCIATYGHLCAQRNNWAQEAMRVHAEELSHWIPEALQDASLEVKSGTEVRGTHSQP